MFNEVIGAPVMGKIKEASDIAFSSTQGNVAGIIHFSVA